MVAGFARYGCPITDICKDEKDSLVWRVEHGPPLTYENFHFLIKPIIHDQRVAHAYARGLHPTAIINGKNKILAEKIRKRLLTDDLGHSGTRQYQNQKNSTRIQEKWVNRSDAVVWEREGRIK